MGRAFQDLCLEGVSAPLSGPARQFETKENHSHDGNASLDLTEEQKESYDTVMGMAGMEGAQGTGKGNLLILNGP